MRCPSCQTENADDAAFCSNCGTKLEARDPGPQPPSPQPDPHPPTPQPTPEPEPPQPEPTPEPPPPPGGGPLFGAPTPSETPTAPMAPAAAAPEATTPMMPGVPGPPEGGNGVLTAGWGKALRRGALAFLIMALLGQALAFVSVIEDPAGANIGDVAKGGGVFLYLFHHVGVAVDLPTLTLPQTADSPFSGPATFSFTISLALMLGTALAGWLLYRGGRATAIAAGGPAWAGAVHGAKVALPYAVLAAAASFLVSFRVPLPPLPFFGAGEPVELGISLIGAVLWPLALGLVAGALGGLSSVRDQLTATPRGRLLLGMTSGGWRMTWIGLVLAFAGYLVVAFLNPDVPLPLGPEYFRALGEQPSTVDAILFVLFTLLIVPNIAVAVLVPAMGGMLGFFGSVAGVRVSCTLLSLTEFPVGAAQPAGTASGLDPCADLPIQLETAPVGYFAFLLIPLIAAFLGGRRAARRGEATSSSVGAGAGALAGVAFAAFMMGLIVLASIWINASGQGTGVSQSVSFSVGPALLIGTVLALAWGAAGGALGGATAAGRRAGSPAVPAPPAAGAPPRGSTGFEPGTPPPPPSGAGAGS